MQGNVIIALLIGILLLVVIVGWLCYCWYQRHVNLGILIDQAHARIYRDRRLARQDVESGNHDTNILPTRYTHSGWNRPKQKNGEHRSQETNYILLHRLKERKIQHHNHRIKENRGAASNRIQQTQGLTKRQKRKQRQRKKQQQQRQQQQQKEQKEQPLERGHKQPEKGQQGDQPRQEDGQGQGKKTGKGRKTQQKTKGREGNRSLVSDYENHGKQNQDHASRRVSPDNRNLKNNHDGFHNDEEHDHGIQTRGGADGGNDNYNGNYHDPWRAAARGDNSIRDNDAGGWGRSLSNSGDRHPPSRPSSPHGPWQPKHSW